MPRDMCTVQYTDDSGNHFSTRADKATIEVAGQAAKLGAVVVSSSTLPALPKSLKPRYVMMRGATSDAVRKVVCYTKDAPLYASGGNLTMETFRGADGATEVFNTVGEGYAERKRRNLTDSPTIS